jgi:hypothetical protein
MESLSKPEQPSLWWFFSSDLNSPRAFDLALTFIYFVSVLLAAMSTLSVSPLWTTLAALLSYNLFKNSIQLTYGVHELLNIAIFYSLLIHAIYYYGAFANKARGAFAVQVALRIHLGIIYASSGIEKALGQQWWTGEAIWRALLRDRPAGYSIFSFEWLSNSGLILQASSIAVLFMEIFYPILANFRRTRLYFLIAIILMHTGIALSLGLWMFSITMITLNCFAYSPLLKSDQVTGQNPAANKIR